MPRNSGTYTLPSASLTNGTTANAVPVQANFADIASALTDSIAADGQTPVTGPIEFSNGNAAGPGVTFVGDDTTGLYLIGSGQLGFSCGGVLQATLSSSGWAAMTLASPTITGTAALAAATFSGSVTLNGSTTVAGAFSFSATTGFVPPTGTTGQRPGSPTNGELRYNSTTNGLEYYNGTSWQELGVPPTYQSFTSGSGNYVPATGVVRIKVRMCGGGGGGSADTLHNGGTGGTTSFGSWTAIGGGGGAAGSAGGVGGTGGAAGTGTLIQRTPGGQGHAAMSTFAGPGGANPFGGGGMGGNFGLSVTPTAGATNTGAGGGAGASSSGGGASGGAGEYVEFEVLNPGTIAYTVGTIGAAGASGVQQNGAAGALGVIYVEEFYS